MLNPPSLAFTSVYLRLMSFGQASVMSYREEFRCFVRDKQPGIWYNTQHVAESDLRRLMRPSAASDRPHASSASPGAEAVSQRPE
jgi:hypothetical protein